MMVGGRGLTQQSSYGLGATEPDGGLSRRMSGMKIGGQGESVKVSDLLNN